MVRPILINGKFVEAQSNKSIEVRNPSTLDLLDSIPACGEADINAAVAAARAAQPAWWRTGGVEKAELLHEVAQRIRGKQRAIATMMTQETKAADRIRRLRQMGGRELRLFRGARPLGARRDGGARRGASGELRPQGALRRGGLHRAVQLSAPAHGLESGAGDCCGQHRRLQTAAQHSRAFCSAKSMTCCRPASSISAGVSETSGSYHPDVDLIAFTGSTAVGKLIAAAAGAQLKINLGSGT
jgi:hypothetical protein